VAKRNSGRRARSRKRRPNPQSPQLDAPAPSRPAARAARRDAGRLGELQSLGERPPPPWHPLPLSELLIFVGLVAVIIGGTRGESGLPVVAAGVLSACVGTLDFTIREHLSGYRPHTTLLATFATALIYGLLAIVLLALGVPAPAYFVVPLVVGVPLFTFLFRLLRARFREARRERTFAAGR
jgi:hypothetical protein